MAQCPRVSCNRRRASARSGLRLVIPWTTSTVFLPFAVRSRTTAKPCCRPAQSCCFVRIVVVRSVRFSRRPCPLSTVVATCPGGGATGRSSGGKSGCSPLCLLLVGQPRFYIDHQGRLVVLGREDVIAAGRDDRRA